MKFIMIFLLPIFLFAGCDLDSEEIHHFTELKQIEKAETKSPAFTRVYDGTKVAGSTVELSVAAVNAQTAGADNNRTLISIDDVSSLGAIESYHVATVAYASTGLDSEAFFAKYDSTNKKINLTQPTTTTVKKGQTVSLYIYAQDDTTTTNQTTYYWKIPLTINFID